jgi:serine/threonine-protein kinase RsbW
MELEIHDGPPVLRGDPLYHADFIGGISAKNAVIEETLGALSARGPLAERDAFGLRLCLDEAIQNAITHGNRGDPDKRVAVDIHESPDGWELVIRDEGSGFRAEDLPDPREPEPLERENGRGLWILLLYMDGIRYHEGGRTLVLWKRWKGAGRA